MSAYNIASPVLRLDLLPARHVRHEVTPFRARELGALLNHTHTITQPIVQSVTHSFAD